MSDRLMPIDFRQINTGQTEAGTKRAEKTSSETVVDEKSGSVNVSAQQDSVELSNKAQLVQSLISDLSSQPEVDQSRVEQVRSSIASGEFSVSADQVANKILALEVGLRELN